MNGVMWGFFSVARRRHLALCSHQMPFVSLNHLPLSSSQLFLLKLSKAVRWRTPTPKITQIKETNKTRTNKTYTLKSMRRWPHMARDPSRERRNKHGSIILIRCRYRKPITEMNLHIFNAPILWHPLLFSNFTQLGQNVPIFIWQETKILSVLPHQ